jgi:hypothetical protein
MLSNKELHICRICGLEQPFFPWGEDGQTPTYDICSCCGVEFGYEDATLVAVRNYRKEWIEKGAKWLKPKEMPESWSLEEQLKNIPDEFK